MIEPRARLCLFLGMAALLAAPAGAQTPPPAPAGPGGAKEGENPTGWTAKAGLSYVQTTGNSKSSNLGFRFNATRNWTRTYFSLVGGAVRNSSSTITRFGVGTIPDTFVLVEDEVSALTAANYLLDASLDRNISDRFFWTTGAGWMRNTFAGIDSRENFRGGVGYFFTDPASKGVQFKTALLGTLTHQTETIADPNTDDTFVGLRLMADLLAPFKNGSFNSRTNLDENLQSTDDFRWTWWNSLGVQPERQAGAAGELAPHVRQRAGARGGVPLRVAGRRRPRPPGHRHHPRPPEEVGQPVRRVAGRQHRAQETRQGPFRRALNESLGMG